ncbi:DUF6916 family protein [Microterricola pindariensis]|uniref:DUF6916 family protein n=1 Tax=Microterricola pindariensis TaxID=478010 RepID=UPI00105751A7|nr:hypothetical protein [Microterricola pindariensis]
MLEVSRRAVLAVGAGAVGVVAVGAFTTPAVAGGIAQLAPAIPAFTPAPSAGLPVRSHFAGHEGETFVATFAETPFAVTLTAIDDVPPAIGTDDENRFNLIFTAPGVSMLPSGIAEITHPAVPAATLFASPAGDSPKRQLQALVNRDA